MSETVSESNLNVLINAKDLSVFNYISKWILSKSLSPHEFLQIYTMIVDFSAFHSALYVISLHSSTYFLRGLYTPECRDPQNVLND